MTMVELVDYKCAECGKIEQFRGDQNGILSLIHI